MKKNPLKIEKKTHTYVRNVQENINIQFFWCFVFPFYPLRHYSLIGIGV